jgi:predicted PurR-regulated permease PerM/phosphoglycolate phosphatase-like HAD superfamily hydrolase
MGSRRWSNVTKIIVTATLAILAIVLLVTFRVMIAPTVVALLLAFILSYPVNWIQRTTGWARSTAISAIYVGLFAITILTPVLVVPRAAELALSLRTTLEELIAELQNVTTGPLLVIGAYRLSLNMLFQQTGNVLQNLLVLSTTNPISIARGVTNSIINIVYVLVLNFWILKDLYKLQRLLLEQIPADYQEDARRLGQEIGEIWHAFLRGQLALGIAVGLLTWVMLGIVGMPNAGGLALLAGLMEFLPSIGPGISGIIGTAVALFRGSLWLPVPNVTFAIIVAILYSIIAQIENIYLIPRLVGRQVKLHPAVTFVAIISGTIVFGLLGVLLAAPIVASARMILSYVHHKLLDLEPFDPLVSAQASVRIPGLIAGRKIDAIVFDLDGTLAYLDWSTPNWAASHLRWLDRVMSSERRCHLTRRLMIMGEGFVNFLITQLRRLNLHQDLTRVLPTLNRLRGYPPAAELLPLPGVADLLARLVDRYRLALVSTRATGEIECFLDRSEIDPTLFSLVLSRDHVRNLLPHSEPLLTLVSQLMLEPAQVLVVSDTDVNLRTARVAQMATAGVLSGLGEARDLQDADLLLISVAELAEWL